MPDDRPHFEDLPILAEMGADLRRAFIRREQDASPPRRRRARSSRGLVVFAAALALSATALAATQPWSSLDEAVQHGQRPVAPDRALPALDGSGESSLKAYRGRIVVLSFWASWCTPCRDQADTLEAAGRRLRADGKGRAVLASYKDTADPALAFVRDQQLTMPVLNDRSGKLARAYGVRGLPETFVIDPRGRVVAIRRRQVSPEFLARAIAKAAKPSGTLRESG